MMKSIFVILTVTIFFKVDADESLIYPGMPEFLVETGTQAIMCRKELDFQTKGNEQLNIGDILVEDSPAFNEYFGCIWLKKKIIDGEGIINVDALRQYFVDLFTMGAQLVPGQRRLIESVLQHCRFVEGRDYMETSVKVHNCALKKLFKAGEDPKYLD